jgi:hypothetical protein
MHEVGEIPDGPDHYFIHTESGTWHYLNLDGPVCGSGFRGDAQRVGMATTRKWFFTRSEALAKWESKDR